MPKPMLQRFSSGNANGHPWAFSWWIGLTIAPTVGGELLSVSPAALFIGSAVAALVAAAAILALERQIPAPARLTPRPI